MTKKRRQKSMSSIQTPTAAESETPPEIAPAAPEAGAGDTDADDTKSVSQVEVAERLVSGIDAACQRAETLEKRLAEAAQCLAQAGENTERKIELLLNGLDAGEVLQGRLVDCNAQLAQMVEGAQQVSGEHQRTLEGLVSACEARMNDLEQRCERLVSNTLETVSSRTQTALTDLGQRITTIEQRTERAAEEAASKIAIRAEAMIADLVREAGSAQTRTTAVMEERVRKFEDAVDKAASEQTSRLSEAVAASEFSVASVRSAAETAGQEADRLKEMIGAARGLQDRTADMVAEASDLIEVVGSRRGDMDVANKRAEVLAAELESRCARATEVTEKARHDTDSLMKFGDGAVARHQRALGGLLEHVKKATQSLQTRVDDAGVKTERLAEMTHTADARGERIERLNAESEKQAANIQRSCLEATATAEEVAARVRQEVAVAAKDSMSAAEEKLVKIRQTVTELVQDTNDMVSRKQQGLGEAMKEADQQVRGVRKATETAERAAGRLDDSIRSGRSVQRDLVPLIERTDNLQTAVEESSETLAALLARAGEVGERIEADIRNCEKETGDIIQSGKDAVSEQRAAMEAAAERSEQLATRTDAAIEAERALCHITASAHDARDRIERASEPLGEQVIRAGELVEALRSASAEASSIEERAGGFNRQVSDLISSGEESLRLQHDSLFAVMSDAEERMDQLRTAMTSAAQQRDEIAEQCRQSGANAAEACERVDALIAEVWSITTATEARTRDLAGESRRAGELLEGLKPATIELETLRDEVMRQSTVARNIAEELKVRIDGANGAAGRMQSLHAECKEVAEALTSHCNRGEEVAEHIFRAAGELQEDHEAIIANRELLNGLNDEYQTLHEMVQRSQVATDSLRVQINSMLTEPQSVVCDAKQQAIQLTKICQAVKKVFSGLSQASLTAAEQIEQLSSLNGTMERWLHGLNEAVPGHRRAGSVSAGEPVKAKVAPPSRMYSLAQPPRRGPEVVTDRPEPMSEPAGLDASESPAQGARLGTRRRISPDVVAGLVADAKRQHEKERQAVTASS